MRRFRPLRPVLTTAALCLAVLALALVWATACGGESGPSSTSTTGVPKPATYSTVPQDGYLLAMSDAARLAPAASQSDLRAVAESTKLVGLDLYRVLTEKSQGGNLVISPSSIVTALAMTYAGALGSTAQEMAKVLHFSLEGEALHQAFNSLNAELESRSWERTNPEGKKEKVLVRTANSLWGQKDLLFEQAFLDTLAANYGAGMRLVDFVNAVEEARQAINAWVAKETEGKIPELIAKGVLDKLTRLVLVNAVYLDATWQAQFDPQQTRDGLFTTLAGTEVTVPMMRQTAAFPYAKGDGWQALELPYVGDQLALLLVAPDEGRMAEVESRLPSGLLDQAVAALQPGTEVELSLPKFKVRTQADLVPVFVALGMKAPFDPGLADFSGITTQDHLYITDIIHEAYLAVDEEGTEAAAATAVVMGKTAMPLEIVKLTLDHPFLFALRDRETGTVLFLGRVADPTK